WIPRLDSNHLFPLTPWDGFNGAQFVAPWMIDPTDTGVIYLAAGNTILKNDSILIASDSWTPLNYTKVSGRGTVISALAVSIAPRHTLFYGTSDGRAFRVDNETS